jgi:hypothetical protein
LNDHRKAEHQGEDTAGEADPVGDATSSIRCHRQPPDAMH